MGSEGGGETASVGKEDSDGGDGGQATRSGGEETVCGSGFGYKDAPEMEKKAAGGAGSTVDKEVTASGGSNGVGSDWRARFSLSKQRRQVVGWRHAVATGVGVGVGFEG